MSIYLSIIKLYNNKYANLIYLVLLCQTASIVRINLYSPLSVIPVPAKLSFLKK